MDQGQTGTIIDGKYELGEVYARSGPTVYYRAQNTLLDRAVSVALVPVEDGEKFIADTRSTAKISHPNVLGIVDFGRDGSGNGYTVHEAPSGELLSTAIEREGRLPYELAVDIARQAGSALSAADRFGTVHGRLSPDQILVSGGGSGRPSVKVLGFGSRDADQNTEPLFDPAERAFRAPEQLDAYNVPDRRCDVYALGTILYAMLAGSPPNAAAEVSPEAETAADAVVNIEPPPPLSAFRQDLPAWIEPVILKAIAEDPDLRYQSADELVNDLSAGLTVAGDEMLPAARPENTQIWKTAFVVLVGVSFLTVGLIYLTYSRQTDPATALQPDANGMPVQPINPATGSEEQNLANLPPDYSLLDGNSNTALPPGVYPGGDGYNPWANGGAPPPGAPSIPPGGQVIQVPPGQSPFMMDPNCILQPSGIYLCPVPITPTPTPRVSPSPRVSPPANANTATPPANTAEPRPTPARTPQRTPASTRTPEGADDKPAGEGSSPVD